MTLLLVNNMSLQSSFNVLVSPCSESLCILFNTSSFCDVVFVLLNLGVSLIPTSGREILSRICDTYFEVCWVLSLSLCIWWDLLSNSLWTFLLPLSVQVPSIPAELLGLVSVDYGHLWLFIINMYSSILLVQYTMLLDERGC